MNATATSQSSPSLAVGRYILHAPIARGGMATVHPARLVGEGGFTRLVAAKRLHPHFADDPEFVAMFRDEARIASMIHHPNVVPVLDVVDAGSEVVLIQEYVHGVPLSVLFKRAATEDEPIDIGIVVAVVFGLLAGLHATHEARDEMSEPLNIVHRDVSTQNVMVTVDGVARLLDFGIAKSRASSHHTREGVFKGKLVYMAPEQLRCEAVTRRADIYATGVILWQLLVNRRLHEKADHATFIRALTTGGVPRITDALEDTRPWISDARWHQLVRLEPVVARALATSAHDRYATAADMAEALIAACAPATLSDVAEWVRTAGADHLEQRKQALATSEESWRSLSRISTAHRTESGIEVVGSSRQEDRSSIPSRFGSSFSASISLSSLAPIPFASRLAPLLPWVATAALLLVLGILVGIVAVGIHPPRAPRAPAAAATAAALAVSTPEAPEPPHIPAATRPSSLATDNPTSITITTAKESPPPATRATHPSLLRQVAPSRAPAPPPTHPSAPAPAASPSAPPPTPAPTATAPKVDCNPPFYFEGSKKVFKPSCL